MEIAVVGSGPVGMAAALLLARQGHRLTLIDRDPGPVSGRRWDRVGVMQFHLPHGFRPQCRRLLRERLPDVLDAVIAAGATVAAVPGIPDSGAMMLVRRAVFERALWEVVSREPGITRLTGHVDAVEIEAGRAVGVVVDSGLVQADLVVDASGRAGRIAQAVRPLGQRVDCRMAYAARQYRLRPGAEPGPRNGGPAFMAQHPGFVAMVFEHDAGTFTVLFVRPADDKALALLRHTSAFEAACQAVGGVAEWTDPGRSEPIDVVRAGAGLTNEYRGQPTGVIGLVAIGDAVCVTNPQGARGITLGLQSAAALADLVADVALTDLAGHLAAWDAANLEPWYRDHLEWDASLLATWSGLAPDADGPLGIEVLLAAAQHRHPEWMATLGPYLAMELEPDAVRSIREAARALLRAGWRPPQPPGITRDTLAALIMDRLAEPIPA
jgi:2-polyprenyl-6-methoxyphenol hydroxylase-like FAD-dependent oxidoreductase